VHASTTACEEVRNVLHDVPGGDDPDQDWCALRCPGAVQERSAFRTIVNGGVRPQNGGEQATESQPHWYARDGPADNDRRDGR
jgi:hypothetical protein